MLKKPNIVRHNPSLEWKFKVALPRMINVTAIETASRQDKASVQQEDECDIQIMSKNGDAGRAFSRGQIERDFRRGMISCTRFTVIQISLIDERYAHTLSAVINYLYGVL